MGFHNYSALFVTYLDLYIRDSFALSVSEKSIQITPEYIIISASIIQSPCQMPQDIVYLLCGGIFIFPEFFTASCLIYIYFGLHYFYRCMFFGHTGGFALRYFSFIRDRSIPAAPERRGSDMHSQSPKYYFRIVTVFSFEVGPTSKLPTPRSGVTSRLAANCTTGIHQQAVLGRLLAIGSVRHRMDHAKSVSKRFPYMKGHACTTRKLDSAYTEIRSF